MSYTINLTNGSLLSTVSDGTIDIISSSLTLIGREYSGYGAFLNENFVKLLENFSNTSSPSSPLKGQLWWDSTNNVLRVWSGQSWKISTGATSSGTAPADLSALGGDLWFDTINQQLKVYTGTGFLVVGPATTPSTGNTGTFPVLMTDTSSGTHVVIQFVIAGTIYAVFSKDTFSTTLPGFTNIVPGLNFNLSVAQTLGLNTQSASALPSTLVLRDSASGITGAAINGTVVTASTVNAGAVNGTFNGTLNGNVSATTVSATTMTSQVFTALSGFTGILLTPNQPNVTGLGNITNLNTTGTTSLSGTVTATGTTNLNGTAYYNGQLIATQGGAATFSSINNTPIGNATPSTGAFTTLAGTLTTAVQPNLTTALNLTNIGTITAGTWHANVISPTYGGTGVNNGSNTLTLSGSYTLNQSLTTTASPTFANLAVNGDITATGDITAYSSSDAKFKENIRPIPNALATVLAIGGDLFDWTDSYVESKGGVDGYFVQKEDFGFVAQKVKQHFPLASRTREDGSLAVDYPKLSALAFAAIGELMAEINELKKKLR